MRAAWRLYSRELVLLGLLVLLFVIVGVRTPSFLSFKTLDTVWHDSALLILLAFAQMPIIISRGIDLSVASNMALSSMIVALLGKAQPEIPFIILLTLGAVIGLGLGCINALMITLLELPPIVATLGTLSVYRGVTYLVSGGQWITANEMSPGMVDFPNLRFGLTSLEWASLLGLLIAWLVTHQSKFGREVRALGGNPTASRYAGINVQRRTFALYALSGTVAGIVGVMWAARYAIASTELAIGFELQVVAACVLGGVSIAGGVGSVFGTALGALFLITLYNALPVIGVSPFFQTAIVGLAILVAAIVNQGRAQDQGKHILRKGTA